MSQTDTVPSQPSATAKDPVLQTVGICVRFGGVTALSEVSLDFLADEVCGLIGPNGAGKTTLFDTISGIRNPTEGRVLFDGVDVTGRSITWRARHGIRRTFQRQQTFGWLSVEDNIMTAIEWRGGGGGLAADLVRSPTRLKFEKARRQRVGEVLELGGIADIAEVPAASLPLGKARMAEMARAIVDHPRVLLLDEPTSGLEESEVENFGQSIRTVRAEEHCTVVLIEHDVGFVMRQSDRVVALNLGQVLAQGTPDEIRNDPAVVKAYFGS
jgi:branched-chain amino acid transport system ATP-binding protein